jgi:hypothetical protein
MAQVAKTCGAMLDDAHDRARAHAENAAPKDSKLVIDLNSANQADVTSQEISDVDDQEYTFYPGFIPASAILGTCH